MTNPWDSPSFAAAWNDTYGADMSRSPMRVGLIYPLLDQRLDWNPQSRIADFGCGNGNLARAFLGRSFAQWVGYDSGKAILSTAAELAATESRVSFREADIAGSMPHLDPHFDHAVSVFTLEEIPAERTAAFFNNLARSVSARQGSVHIFTQHPAYALQQDLLAREKGQPNTKFEGHRGYFDASASAYTLEILNRQKGEPVKIGFHHKPLGMIINGLSEAGLGIKEMLEVPAGRATLDSIRTHVPSSGDVPRFLYLQARPF